MRYYNNAELQPVHVADAWNLDRYLFTAIAYIARAGKKTGSSYQDDILKALWFLAYAVTRNTEYADTAKIVCTHTDSEVILEKQNTAYTSIELPKHVGATVATRDDCKNRPVCGKTESQLVCAKCNNTTIDHLYAERVTEWLKGAIE
jgi:hypothetical protein